MALHFKNRNHSIDMLLKTKNQGFTLIELMVVILIIGILAAIAYPSYVNFVRNARLQNAKADIMIVKNTLEKYYAQNHSFRDGDDYPNIVLNSVNNPFFNIGFYTEDEAAAKGEPILSCNPANAEPDQYCLYAVARDNNEGETRFIFSDATGLVQECETAGATIENNKLTGKKQEAVCQAN